MAVSSSLMPEGSAESVESLQMPVLLRGSLARSIYERMLREEQLRQFDRRRWYSCDLSLIDAHLRESFIQMHCDEETEEFIDLCYTKADWYFTHLFHSIARTFLCFFMSSTSANGLLGRGSMFVFSDKQLHALLGDDMKLVNVSSISNDSILLDVGAGDGKVTQVMAQYFSSVYTTEISPVMRKLLAKRGFTVLDVDEWQSNGIFYDLISCLNVLDRCDQPLTLLQQMKTRLKENTGRILLALVFPFSQYVEVNGRNGDHRAKEQLLVEGNSLETQLMSFRDNVLKPNGLEIVKWTKLPYLCEGDLDLTYYWLYDVVMLLKPIS